ncbi:MAG: hypothetical protein K0R82_2256, partial [Flavipsychrobacter sp.]|nr:hypothetical protein [Flavipsychrobacter sp.]
MAISFVAASCEMRVSSGETAFSFSEWNAATGKSCARYFFFVAVPEQFIPIPV